MVRNLVVLADGTEIFSGGEGSAVMSLELTESVSTGKELTPGAVCAQMAQLTLLDMGDLHLCAGDSLQLYQVQENGERTSLGEFLAEKPERSGHLLKVTAYDRLIALDRDLSLWLAGLQDWPYTLQEFGEMVCGQCGLTLREGELPNGELSLMPFTRDGVTGRQLLSWVAEAAGCFCCLREGQVEMTWYTDAPVAVGPVQLAVALSLEEEGIVLTLPEQPVFAEGTLTVTDARLQLTQGEDGEAVLQVTEKLVQQYFYQDNLTLEDYQTAPIEKVQLRQSAEDVGTVYPDLPEGNTLAITGNPLLAARDAQSLLPAAQTLFARLEGSSYTPCTLRLPDTPGLAAGQRLTLLDAAGRQHRVYIMELSRSARGLDIRCTGSPRRDSSFAVNRQEGQLQGKVLKLQTDVDGLMAENSDNSGKIARLQLDVEGIRGQISARQTTDQGVQEQLSRLEQTASGVQITLEQLQQEGTQKVKTAVGYTFDDRGLQIAREGEQMKNLLDNTGMYVTRSGETVLRADHLGVEATDVTVRNYLIVGNRARFEDYLTGRTACFYLEG